jgi:hypothetical protein
MVRERKLAKSHKSRNVPQTTEECAEGGLSVNFPAMGDPEDEDLTSGVIHLIEDAVVTDPDSPALLVAAQFDGPGWARGIFQPDNGFGDARVKIWGKVSTIPLSRRPWQCARGSLEAEIGHSR